MRVGQTLEVAYEVVNMAGRSLSEGLSVAAQPLSP